MARASLASLEDRVVKTLLIATRNTGKTREFRNLFADLPFRLADLNDFDIQVDVPETGASFEENAQLKAIAYCRMAAVLTLADDSGLEVDALGGEPGVWSARYGGPGKGESDRVELLLSNMSGVPGWQRTARFRAVLALAAPPNGKILETTSGSVEGAICHEPLGQNGFGYDPIFWLPSRAMTMAQLTDEEKNAISHRGKAAIAMSKFLATFK